MAKPSRAAERRILEPLFIALVAAKSYIPAPAIAPVGPVLENVT